MGTKFKHYFWIFLPIFILMAAIGLRFYRLTDLLYFMIDEERYSFLMKRLYLDHKLMLVGIAIPGGFYLGPAYLYFSGLLQWLFKFNPVLMGGLSSFVGVASTVIIYRLGKKFLGQTPAIIAMAFYAFSYLIVIYGRIYWTLTWSSLAALVTYWGLEQIITAKKYWWLYPMTFFYILGSQSDASYFSLIVMAAIVLWRHIKNWKPLRKTFITALGLFIGAQLPLVAFDLRHNFYNTKLFVGFFSRVISSHALSIETVIKSLLVFPKTIARLLVTYPPYDVTYQLSSIETTIADREKTIAIPLIILSVAILTIFLVKSWKGKRSLLTEIIKTHILVAIGGVLVYNLIFPGYTHEWFLTVLFPALALVIAMLLELMLNAGWGWLVVPLLVLLIVCHTQALIKTDNAFGFGYKRQAVKFALSQVGSRPFYLDAIGTQAYGGYRYLFWLFGQEPTHSFMDNVYGNWIYPMPAPKSYTEVGIIMVSLSDLESRSESQIDIAKVRKWRQQAIAREKFGGIEVLVIPSMDKSDRY